MYRWVCPSDIEQQEGRILRQGNQNQEVYIFCYITENTFDSYSWQLIENKQKFISQVMTGKRPVRSCEDIDESVLSYAEVKALATGNPHIKEKMALDVEVAKLKMLKANFSSQKYRMEDNITINYPERIAALEEKAEGYSADIQAYMQNRPADRDTFSMKVGSKVYYDRKEAGAALIGMCRHISGIYVKTEVGEYQGFKMSASYSMLSTKCTIHMQGSVCHDSESSSDPFGIIQRLDNVLEAMPKELEKLQRELENVRSQLETAKVEVAKPFEKEQELQEKSRRLAELNAMLNMDESGDEGQPEPEGQVAEVQEQPVGSTGMEQPEVIGQPTNAQPVGNTGTEQPEVIGQPINEPPVGSAGTGQPSIEQVTGSAEMDQQASAGWEDDIGVQDGYSQESAAQGSHGLAQDAEIQPLSVAESGGYGDSAHKTDAEMQQAASTAQNISESGEQGQDVNMQPEGSPYPTDMCRSVETSGENTMDTPQRTDMQQIPGCMEVRVSIREKLSAIRERRAKEQGHGKGQPQKTGQRQDREAAL